MRNRLTSLVPFVVAMTGVVAASNYLVQFPVRYAGLHEILTWGAFTYPLAFLVNDMTNRRFGATAARRVVLAGFALAVLLSIWLASPRIAIASGSAFLVAQLIDTGVFDRLRALQWWRAPLISSVIGSVVDTALFFGLAFAPAFAFLDTSFGLEDVSLGNAASLFGMEMPLYASLAIGDLAVKLIVGVVALVPYAGFLAIVPPKAA